MRKPIKHVLRFYLLYFGQYSLVLLYGLLSFRTHMQNIKDITGSIHYETYRVRRLNESNAHFKSQPSDQPAVQPKANGQPEVKPSAPQANGVAAKHEVMSHEM